MRQSLRLLTTQKLTYHLGLSYAAKQSPPFIPPNGRPASAGFATPLPGDKQLDENGAPLPPKSKLTKWVEGMKLLPAGRGELRASNADDGGWDQDLRERVWKWGAGEDFFAVVDGGNFVSPRRGEVS